MKHLTTIKKGLLLALCVLLGGANVWGETLSKSWDLTSASSDWVGNGNVAYFSQPYGFKKANATLTNKSITDFNQSGITEIKVGFKCLQNGATTSKLTIFLVNSDGNPIGNGVEVTPDNATAASKTTYKYATFTENLESATGFMMKVTTFGKNILVNGAEYVVTYTLLADHVAPPTFSLEEGTFWSNQTLELTSTVDGGTIYYTNDGSDPTTSETATAYNAALTLSETTTIKACVKDGEGNYSDVVSHTYTFVPSIANTKETAFTTSEAIAPIDKTSSAQLAAEKVYVKGTVSKVDSYNSTDNAITYWLDDNTFEVYLGKNLNTDFSAKTDIKIGADVIIYGNVKKFYSTYGFDKDNYLVEYTPKTITSVALFGTPSRTIYEVGEAFDHSGMTLIATYEDGTQIDVTSSAIWSAEPKTITAETTKVIVSTVFAQTNQANKEIEVTIFTPTPVTGNSIIVAAYGNNQYAAMTKQHQDTYFASTEIFKSGDKYIVTDDISNVLFRTETTNNLTTIQDASTSKYIQCTGAKEVSFSLTQYSWLADKTKLNATPNDWGSLQFNSGSPRFTTYTSKVGQYAYIVDIANVAEGAALTLSAKDGSDYYATFSSDKAVEFVDATVYTVGVNGTKLVLNEVKNKQVPANTGVLIKTTNTKAVYMYINSASALENNLLLPSSIPMKDSGYKYYKLAYGDWEKKTGLGFYWGAENGAAFTPKAGGAYLLVPAETAVKGFAFGGDIETAIEAVETEAAQAEIFDLSGRKVSKAVKGLYIINGKKVVK